MTGESGALTLIVRTPFCCRRAAMVTALRRPSAGPPQSTVTSLMTNRTSSGEATVTELTLAR